MRLFRMLCCTTVLVLLFGCAATVNRGSGDSPASSFTVNGAKTVILSMQKATTLAPNPDWDDFVEEWQTSMSNAAAASGLMYHYVADASDDSTIAGILVKVKVKAFRYVSQAKRYAVGVFSGNASMDVDVTYVEIPGGKTVANRNFTTSSSFIQGAFSAMTPKQVAATSSEIVKEISGK